MILYPLDKQTVLLSIITLVTIIGIINSNQILRIFKSLLPESKAAYERNIKRVEELDKEYFNLYTEVNLTNDDPDVVQKTISTLRENQEEYKLVTQEIEYFRGAKDSVQVIKCIWQRESEFNLRNYEEYFVLSKSADTNYERIQRKKNFVRERLNLERDFTRQCKEFYDFHLINLIKFD